MNEQTILLKLGMKSFAGISKIAFIVAAIVSCVLLPAFSSRADNDFNNGSANIGERLFLETRFAEFFFTNSSGNANAALTNSDPVMSNAASIYGALPGPFSGYSMNCRQCHMVEEEENNNNAILPSFDSGNRTYCDFAQRSPIPNINDGRGQAAGRRGE